MGSDNIMVIDPVDHSLVLPALCFVLLLLFCIYQLTRLIIILHRRKGLYSAAWMIIEGHDKLERDSRVVTVDGEILTNDFVKRQISKNEEKIERIRRKHKYTEKSLDVIERDAPCPDSPAVFEGHAPESASSSESSSLTLANDNTVKVKIVKKKAVPVEAVLNSIYEEDDLFYDAMHAYYMIRIPDISDETVRKQVFRKTRNKIATSRKKQKLMKEQLEKYSVFD